MTKIMMHNNSKQTLLLFSLLLTTLTAMAQKFDPQRFEAERAHFMVQEAQLSPTDSATFFTLFNEMEVEKRQLYVKMKELPKQMPSTDDSCKWVVIERDRIDLQMKSVEQQYHERMLNALNPSLVFRLLKAETAFCRQTFRRAAKKMNNK